MITGLLNKEGSVQVHIYIGIWGNKLLSIVQIQEQQIKYCTLVT